MLSKSPKWSWVTENRSDSVIFYPIFLGRELLLRASNLSSGSTDDGNTLNNIPLYCYLATSAYSTVHIISLSAFILMNLLFVVVLHYNFCSSKNFWQISPPPLFPEIFWSFWMVWTLEWLRQRAGELSQKKTLLASPRTVSALLNHVISTAISSSYTTQIFLPVTNSQERLIEAVSAKVLGTTALPREEAGGGLEKRKNGSGRSNQRGWHFKLCDVRRKHFVLLKSVIWMFTCCRDGVGEGFIDMG